MNKICNIGLLTSGGDAPGMNACIRSIVRTGIFYKMNIIGIKRGYNGLIENDFCKLNTHSVANIIQRGGTILKTARSEKFKNRDGMDLAYKNLLKNKIDILIVIGGNGTFNGAYKFYNLYNFPIIAIPATIDNDLYGTDFTIGYDTAINTVVNTVDKIRDTAESHERLFLVEVMGKNTGYIALNSGISIGAEAIILPKYNDNINYLYKRLKNSRKNKSSKIIILAEGNKIGTTSEIAQKINNEFPYYDTKITILGHIQRGGTPTCIDRIIASRMGYAAINSVINNVYNIMIGIHNNNIRNIKLNNIINIKKEYSSELLSMVDILSS